MTLVAETRIRTSEKPENYAPADVLPFCSHSVLNSATILTRRLHSMLYYCMVLGCCLSARMCVDHQSEKDLESKSPSP